MTDASSCRGGITAYDDARCRVLAEHAVLRVLLEQVRQAAVEALRGACGLDLRDTCRTLCLVLEAHALREERLLHPSFVSEDKRHRVEKLHERQADALAELRRAQDCGPVRCAVTAERLLPGLLAVLELEEHELFEIGPGGSAPRGAPRSIAPNVVLPAATRRMRRSDR